MENLYGQALSSIWFEKQQEIELSSWSRTLGVIVLMRIAPTLPFNSMYFFFVLDAPRVFRFVNSQYSIHDRFAAQYLKKKKWVRDDRNPFDSTSSLNVYIYLGVDSGLLG